MKFDINVIKELRDETGAGVLEVKNALEAADGDTTKAKEELMKKAAKKAEKKNAERETKDGLVYPYIHSGGKVGSLLMLACETDFVAKTDDFKSLCHNIAMQICTDDYESVESLMDSEFIKDGSKKISDLITEAVGKLGEKIEIRKFVKYNIFE